MRNCIAAPRVAQILPLTLVTPTTSIFGEASSAMCISEVPSSSMMTIWRVFACSALAGAVLPASLWAGAGVRA
jgi:hypothetical protein